ncbi:unnamed protein product, partial [Vitis vinifera]
MGNLFLFDVMTKGPRSLQQRSYIRSLRGLLCLLADMVGNQKLF